MPLGRRTRPGRQLPRRSSALPSREPTVTAVVPDLHEDAPPTRQLFLQPLNKRYRCSGSAPHCEHLTVARKRSRRYFAVRPPRCAGICSCNCFARILGRIHYGCGSPEVGSSALRPMTRSGFQSVPRMTKAWSQTERNSPRGPSNL